MKKQILAITLLCATPLVYAQKPAETLPQVLQETMPQVGSHVLQNTALILQKMSGCLTAKNGQFDPECANQTGEQVSEQIAQILTAPETQAMISRSRPHLEKSAGALSQALETISADVFGQKICTPFSRNRENCVHEIIQ